AVVGLHTALVGFAVGQVLLFEHHRPGVGRRLEDVGVVHQHIGTRLVGHAVVLAVHGVPGSVLQAGVDVLVAGHQAHIHFLHQPGGDQAPTRVAGGGHDVVAARLHQGHHFVGGGGGLDVDL